MKGKEKNNCNDCKYKKMSILEWVGVFSIIITIIFVVIYLIIKSFFPETDDSVITTVNVAISAILGAVSVFLGILSYNGSNDSNHLKDTLDKMQNEISNIHDFTYNLNDVNNDLKEAKKHIEFIPNLRDNIQKINDLVIKTETMVDNINTNMRLVVNTKLQNDNVVEEDVNPKETTRTTGLD